MEGLHHGADDDARISDQPDPGEEVPYPRFLRSQRNARLQEAGGDSVESSGASEQPGEHSREEHPRRVGFMSPNESDSRSGSYTSRSGSDDPWMDPSRDPWRTYAVDYEREENWSSAGSDMDRWDRWSSSNSNWSYASGGVGWQDRNYDNWSDYDGSNKWESSSQYTSGSWHSDGDTMLIPIVMEISVDERIVGKMLGVTITDESKYQMLQWRKTSG